MDIKIKKLSLNRIVYAVLIILALFIILITRLVILQIFESAELSQKQEEYMTKKVTLTAARGDIYDRNMNILAKDASCSKVSVFPNSVSDPEATAKYLSEKLALDYNSVYAKVTNVKMDFIDIKRGVDNQTALDIKDANLNGIVISEDKKRYYTDSNFAQYVLGFTGTDHVGLYGIEAVYNDILKGEDGIETLLADSKGRQLESSVNVKKDAVPGSNVILSIDSVIQYYAEDAVYRAYLANKPKRVIAIVSDPNTGEILAMAAYPGYNLDNPWELTQDFQKSFGSSLANMDIGNKQLEMWKNPFTSFIYEPGSTFKVITASSALEENIITLDSRYYCGGSLVVGGIKIKCHIFPRGHGSQNLTEAVSNSCNVAMMQVGMAMGPDIFYKYIYNYGFGEKTGINLDNEESGILTANQQVNVVDYVTLAFGQGLGVTPIQMMQAINAAVNGGELLKPTVVKYITEADTNKITYTYNKQVVRRVISNETSVEMRNILKTTADNNPALGNYRDIGMGGKTGTAQKFIGSSYAPGLYVASFYGFAPYDNPQLSVMVIVDEPGGYLTTGSSVASPIGGEILKNSLNYLKTKDVMSVDVTKTPVVTIPDLRGKTKSEAESILNTLNIAHAFTGDENGIITDQNAMLTEYQQGAQVTLKVSSEAGTTVIVPNLTGMTIQNVNQTLSNLGLVLNADGGGIAFQQSVPKGTAVQKGTVINVKFKYIE